jgi:hypothetical protein
MLRVLIKKTPYANYDYLSLEFPKRKWMLVNLGSMLLCTTNDYQLCEHIISH